MVWDAQVYKHVTPNGVNSLAGSIHAETFQGSSNLSSRGCRRHDSLVRSLSGLYQLSFSGESPYVFASVSRGQVEIMFQRIDGYQETDLYHLRSGGVWDAYIRMEGVRELYETVKDQVEITMPLRQQPYGDWEFEVQDPNGYILVFSELIE